MTMTMNNELPKIDFSKYGVDTTVISLIDIKSYPPSIVEIIRNDIIRNEINNKRTDLNFNFKPMIKSKYKAKKTVVDGITFDSKKEACRYVQLKLKEEKGEISNLELQKRYELIPKQVDDNGKVVYRAVHYIADFVYDKDGQTIVEDTKGVRTADFIIKEKLMYQVHGIKISEI